MGFFTFLFKRTPKVMFTESFHQTPNKRAGVNEKKYLVLHHTNGWSKDGNPKSGDASWCLNPKSGVSYHAIIAWNGDRVVLGKDDDVVYHAGTSAWKGRSFCNGFTIGLAFGGDTNNGSMRPNGQKSLTQEELDSAVEYILPRMKKYNWKLEDIITHAMISPGRKTDTSAAALAQVREALSKKL